MNESLRFFVALCFGLTACNVEHYGCDGDWFDDDDGKKPKCCEHSASGGDASANGDDGDDADSAGGTSTSGNAGGSSAGSAGSATAGSSGAGSAGGGSGGAPPVASCDEERDCAPGHNCDLEKHVCVASDQETCGELATESACSNRRDCVPIYAGKNCSCGQDCECKGGEPGCVCESFDFFGCEAAK